VPLNFDHVDITSPNNRWIKLARSLHRKRQRYRERAILVEGVHPLQEAYRVASSVTAVLLSADVAPEAEAAVLASAFAEIEATVLRVDSKIFARASDTESPQGILAIAPMPEREISVPEGTSLLALIADRIRDPGNLGTLLRSAQGAGAHGVFIGAECADPFSPKVVRAAMGSHFHVPIQFLDWTAFPSVLQDSRVYAAAMNARMDYDQVNWQEPCAIIVGNESMGLSERALQAAQETVGIPLANNLESLNAAVAGSIILFEAARQRRKGWELEDSVHTHG
jgi:RNA methyltransferase, TrmH family